MAFDVLLSPPDVGELEQEYVLDAVRSGWVAPAGPHLTAFEREFAERCDVPFAVALSSGTAALHLALVAWGVGPGDVVVTSTLTFAATAFPIVYVGAEPFFVDCDPLTANMDPELLDEAIASVVARGQRVAAIVPVDMFGKCCDYPVIEAVASSHGVRVLCDSAEAAGASRKGRPAGSWGDASVLSFNGNKILTTSGGGMLLTRDEELASRVRYLSTQARQPVEHYQHTEIGYNYRLSNVLAAIGRAQLVRLPRMMKRRREWRERYRGLFAEVDGVALIGGESDGEDNCWLTSATVEEGLTGWSARYLRQALAEQGVESRPVWKPLHLQPAFHRAGGNLNGTAEALFARGIALPSGSSMTDEQFDHVERVIEGVCR